jgi:hypothetical protein
MDELILKSIALTICIMSSTLIGTIGLCMLVSWLGKKFFGWNDNDFGY